MLKQYSKISFILILLFFYSITVSSQNYIELVKDHLQSNKRISADIQDLQIINEVYTKRNDITRVYMAQQVNGIPIHNSMVVATFKNGEIIYLSENLENQIASRTSVTSPSLDPAAAAMRAVSEFNLGAANFSIDEAISSQEFILSDGGVSLERVPVKLVYTALETGELVLSWDLSIYQMDAKHWWSVRVDAVTGAIVNVDDWVISCTFPKHNHREKGSNITSLFEKEFDEAVAAPFAGESYNVYALPLESPNHGDRTIVTDPQDVEASPFGWHDTDGIAGAEFTITRGNNVFARQDLDGNNGTGDSPDGGDSFSFDFSVDLTRDASASIEAAMTNLFYWNNVVHDIFSKYGFDEASGNFQQTNYTGDGFGFDAVLADAQDGSGINNATFATPADGRNPRMQMFLWNSSGEQGNLEVVSPVELAGSIELSISSFLTSDDNGNLSFFELIETPGPDALLVLVEDDNASVDSDDLYDACDAIVNPEELVGNIALVRRGACNFTVKVASAQAAGAIGVIVVNSSADDIINLGGVEDNLSVIPSGMINQADGEALIAALEAGTMVMVNPTRPNFVDASFDNGIVVHEYGHGISTRLTGGPFTSCLGGQAEQAGEGWSDYFGLMLTMTASDTAEQARGIGTFSIGQPIDGGGIRPAPYSTDRSINDLSYDDTNQDDPEMPGFIPQPHGIGTVWATILWDMTWDLIDLYGFDPDLYNGTGGNNTALQLVIDGLKNQPCAPGFVDGRDAILAAVDMNERWTTDEERRDAKCLVYTAFANRGVGFSASQGASDSRTDQVEAIDFPEGNDNFCDVLSVGGVDVDSVNFSVFPNPSNGTMSLRINNSVGNGSINIYDINGRLVYTKEALLEGNVGIEAGNLSSGIYLLQVQGELATETIKLIIE